MSVISFDSSPRQLPRKPSSLRPADLSSLSLDQSLSEVPAVFIRDVLKDLAPRLLSGINCTTLDPSAIPPPDKSLPTHARCTFDPSLAPSPSPLPPTFLLALTFPATNPNLSPPTKILVPAHSLLYVLESPLFPLSATGGQIDKLSAPPTLSAAAPSSSSLFLPILGPIELPSLQAFSILHTYLHTRSIAALHQSLTTRPASSLRLPSPPPSPTLSSRPPPRSTATPPPYDPREPLGLLKLVEDLWRTVVKLEISDQGLWETMESSWEELVGRISESNEREAQ